MTGVHAAVVACVVVALGAGGLDPSAQAPLRNRRIPPAIERGIQDALAAYAGGDDLAAERWVTSVGGRTTLADLELFATRDTTPWSRAKPAFLLEVATALTGANAVRVPGLLKAGLAQVVSRPAAIGADPAGDRFELVWHQAALGVAQGTQQYWLQQDLLDVIRLRYAGAGEAGPDADTRVPLARAIAAAGLCCWKPVPGEMIQHVPASARRPVSADQAVALFEAAAAMPALRVEALIRGAVLLSRVGRDAEALTWFDRVPAHEDRVLGFVHHFTHGRLLDGANRAERAAVAYTSALTFDQLQPAAIGLAAALLRLGRAEEAVAAANRARAIANENAQPDAAFRRADVRFVPGWIAEIRRLRR